MTLPLLSTTFTDGELIDEAALYTRVFQAINAIYATQTANVIQRGTVNVNMGGTAVATATLTIPSPYSNTPQILLNSRLTTGTNYVVGKISPGPSGCTVRCATLGGGNSSETVVVDWVSIGN